MPPSSPTVTLKDLPAALRPREKLLAQGPAALADAELLALLLRTGYQGTSVLAMAEQVLQTCGGIGGLLRTDARQLGAIKGLGGSAKRAELLAVFELARRALLAQIRERPLLDSPDTVRSFLRLQLAELDHEVFAVLFLDSQHRLMAYEPMFRGTLSQTSVYPREVVKRALSVGAGAVVLAHNHPSGVAEPSRADEFITQQLRQALALVDVRVLDHFVVSREAVVSFAERGLL